MNSNQFLHFGYFITKPITKPECIKITSKTILTASKCFCDLIPDFWHLVLEKTEAQTNAAWAKLTKEQFIRLKLCAQEIFDRIIFNEFFVEFSDALAIQTYFPDYGIFSLGISEGDSIKLYEEMRSIGKDNAYTIKFHKPKTDGVFCGYDILGWEGGFHTYLCNGLDEHIREKYNLKINEYGLIGNAYDEVADFAKLIEGEGEPVLWLPYAIYKH